MGRDIIDMKPEPNEGGKIIYTVSKPAHVGATHASPLRRLHRFFTRALIFLGLAAVVVFALGLTVFLIPIFLFFALFMFFLIYVLVPAKLFAWRHRK